MTPTSTESTEDARYQVSSTGTRLWPLLSISPGCDYGPPEGGCYDDGECWQNGLYDRECCGRE